MHVSLQIRAATDKCQQLKMDDLMSNWRAASAAGKAAAAAAEGEEAGSSGGEEAEEEEGARRRQAEAVSVVPLMFDM